MPAKRLFLIDAYSYVFRAFYAIRGLATSKGLPTGAIYGFVTMLNKLIKEHQPDYLALALDSSVPTFRHQQYKEYKAHRDRMPEELEVQIPYIFKLAQAYDLPTLEYPGAEADDIIGTVAKEAEAQGFEVYIVTGDKDAWQLISDRVKILDAAKDRLFGLQDVKERFQVGPNKLADVFGLAGDASDNIPGVPGIGEKTASDLIAQFGDLESLFENLDKVKGEKKQQALKEHTEMARLSKQLFTIKTDLPLELDLEQLKRKERRAEVLANLLDELEFTRLRKELTPQANQVHRPHQVVNDRLQLTKLLREAKRAGRVALYPHFLEEEAMRAQLLGLGLAVSPEEPYYLPWEKDADKMEIKELMEAEELTKYSLDIKILLVVMAREGVAVKGKTIDPAIAAYLLEPGWDSYGPEALASAYLDVKTIFSESGTKRESGAGLALFQQRPAEVACESASLALRLAEVLLPRLKQEGLEALFFEVEMPLAHVLADMERTGIKLDPEVLRRMSLELDRELESLTQEIYSVAGEEFNINSPKQLQTILFEKLKLPPVTKTKTGYSTDVSVLEKLAADHPLPRLILDYRGRNKLKTTYVDALPNLINPETGRIHSCFSQTGTATGRLSSRSPNLQNIPVKTDLGKRIREAFVAEAGHLLLCADYSQIELRVLAHLSSDPKLIEAFSKDEDIHVRTAGEIFGVKPAEVTPQMRGVAKTVNFAIIYGMSPFGLSQQLNIPTSTAKEYIDKYFQTYTGVSQFRESLLEEARRQGYVATLTGRKRYLPAINSLNANERGLAERMALNTPIQGTAADMIKKAMVTIWQGLKGMESKMILSVHDELIFEVLEKELEPLKQRVKQAMEGALTLSVPVKVNFAVGSNWGAAY